MPIPEMNAHVVRRMDLAPDLFVLRVAPDGWELPDFKPGQFGVLGMRPDAPRCSASDPEATPPHPEKLIRRAYSIASSSLAGVYLDFYIVLVKTGGLTPRLFNLKPGDRIWLAPKITGMFTLDSVPNDVNLALIATGTGLAPYLSMVRTHADNGTWRRVAILHGARQSMDLGYHDELEMLAKYNPKVDYLPIISRPQNELVPWTGNAGYVQDLWKKKILHTTWGFDPTPENTHIYLCGNPGMIDEMMATLEAEGFKEHTNISPGQIHVEKYW